MTTPAQVPTGSLVPATPPAPVPGAPPSGPTNDQLARGQRGVELAVAATAVVTEVQAAFPNFANKGLAQAALIALPVLFLSPASQGSGLGATLTSSKVLGLAGVAAVALVKDIPRRDFGKISAVQFRRTDQNLTVGSRSKFLCEKVDERGNTMPVLDDITFASSHPYVVKVDEDGVVEALQVGTATITASIGDKSDLVTVQVARPEEERQGVHPHGTKAS